MLIASKTAVAPITKGAAGPESIIPIPTEAKRPASKEIKRLPGRV
jgi:hypothetical protein